MSVKWIFHVHTFLMFCFHSILFPLQVRLVREMKSKFSFSASFQRPTIYLSVFAQLARGRKPAGYLFTLQRAKVTSCLGGGGSYKHTIWAWKHNQECITSHSHGIPSLLGSHHHDNDHHGNDHHGNHHHGSHLYGSSLFSLVIEPHSNLDCLHVTVLNHIATWTVYSTIMLGGRLLWVCV